MKDYKILQKGTDGKVLVEWTRQKSDFYPEGKEYSVHTVGFHGGLVWGHYFKTFNEAKKYFKPYEIEIEGKLEIKRLYNKEHNLLLSEEQELRLDDCKYYIEFRNLHIVDLNKNEYIEVNDVCEYDWEEITEEQFLDMLSKTSFEVCPITKCLCI